MRYRALASTAVLLALVGGVADKSCGNTVDVKLTWTAASGNDSKVPLVMHWQATGSYNTSGLHSAGKGISEFGGFSTTLHMPSGTSFGKETVKTWVDPLGNKSAKWTCTIEWPGQITQSRTANAVACSNH